MERGFWLERWRNNLIGFHQPDHNPLLVSNWSALEVPAGAGVFVPLCGKSLDMRWLSSQGHPVHGIELSSIAVKAFFEDAGEAYQVSQHGAFECYQGDEIEILCGDFFELTAAELKNAGGVYDRGALVAMSPEDRSRYVDHLLRVIPEGTRILLITLEYDQNLVSGPPFSVHPDEVGRLYGERCVITPLSSRVTEVVPPHFQEQGVARAAESIYRIAKVN
jgi:thiopurine S-methyltransferase